MRRHLKSLGRIFPNFGDSLWHGPVFDYCTNVQSTLDLLRARVKRTGEICLEWASIRSPKAEQVVDVL